MKTKFSFFYTLITALLLLVLFAGCAGRSPASGSVRTSSSSNISSGVGSKPDEDPGDASQESDDESMPVMQTVGSYHTAADYEAIRDILKKYEEEIHYYVEAAAAEESGGAPASDEKSEDVETAQMDAQASEQNASSSGQEHSETNLQTEGVDEADVVKTDGRFVYTLERTSGGDRVAITAIRDGKFDFLGYVDTTEISEELSIREFYVDGDTLQIIGDCYDTELKEDDGYYRTESKSRVYVLTYDMGDRRDVRLSGSAYVTGSYRTSRRTNGFVYLFTDNYLVDPGEDVEAEEWMPEVNGKVISADSCFIPSEGSRNLLMITSIDTKEPSEVVDNKSILYRGSEPYISRKSILLRSEDYQGNETRTELVKFSYSSGKIEPVAATNVRGTIRDTFAINESGDILRVLTSGWDGTSDENHLFILDQKLKRLGSIENIAPGEQIYSARFFGDIAYFVTYRNTDPLFAVDLSDPMDPQILGELKVTGFSEYLHNWDQNRLFGIGFETDPESGWSEGVKLSMFDVGKPEELSELNRSVLRDYQESPAMYNYKTVLIDKQKNLIGFVAYSWERNMAHYLLYRYSDEKGFEKVLEEKLDECWGQGLQRVRGLYVGDTFILSEEGRLRSYDLTTFELLDGYNIGDGDI